jgi:hypothetical protein
MGKLDGKKVAILVAGFEQVEMILRRETRQADAVCRGGARDIIRGNIEQGTARSTWSCEGRSRPRWVDRSAGDAEAIAAPRAFRYLAVGPAK